MSDIFISYASEDRHWAEMLAQTLEGRGWSAFWDRTIPIGKTWRETIGRELDGARCVIVLWSKTSIESGWVQEEADDANRRGILVPVLIENVQPPIGFRSIQAAHLENWNGTEPTQAFRRLIADITALIGPPSKKAEKEGAQAEAKPEHKAEEERKRAASEAKAAEEKEVRRKDEDERKRRKATEEAEARRSRLEKEAEIRRRLDKEAEAKHTLKKEEEREKRERPSARPSPHAARPAMPELTEQMEHVRSAQAEREVRSFSGIETLRAKWGGLSLLALFIQLPASSR
jgi:TIR domain-containing protein